MADAGNASRMRHESYDLRCAHLTRMPLALKQGETANPLPMRLLGSQRKLLEPRHLPQLFLMNRSFGLGINRSNGTFGLCSGKETAFKPRY